jgi:hypothetical protein
VVPGRALESAQSGLAEESKRKYVLSASAETARLMFSGLRQSDIAQSAWVNVYGTEAGRMIACPGRAYAGVIEQAFWRCSGSSRSTLLIVFHMP